MGHILTLVIEAATYGSAHKSSRPNGGIRTGSDVVIALAHGAHAVLAGRAYVYGLGAAGEAGVRKAFAILKKEIEDTMRLLGCNSIHDLTAEAHLLPYPFSGSQP